MRTHIYNRLLLLLPYSLSGCLFLLRHSPCVCPSVTPAAWDASGSLFDLVLIFEELSEASLAASVLWDQTGL